MLKESGSPQAASVASGAADDGAEAAGGQQAAGGGVVLTATPVLAPPPGVKVFTLSNASKLASAAARPRAEAPDAQAQVARGAAPAEAAGPGLTRDPPQVKFVQLPAAAAAGAGRGALAAAALRAAAARPAVKIVMSRANFRKLVATAHKASPPAGAGGGGGGAGADESVVVVPEQFVRSASPQYLRSQLLCAHAALQELAAELRAAEARLRLYEPAPAP